MKLELHGTCVLFSERTVEALNKGSRPASYPLLVSRIQKQLPELYTELSLNLINPWSHLTRKTKTHYIILYNGAFCGRVFL